MTDIAGQSREVPARTDALLTEAGSYRSLIQSATVYLRDISDFGAMDAEWAAWVPAESAPARATIGPGLTSPGLLIEVTIVAAAQRRRWLVDAHPSH